MKLKAYLMMISSMLIFGTIGIFRVYIPISSSQLAFCRGIIGAVTLIVVCLIKKKSIISHIQFKSIYPFIIIGILIGINWIFLFEAYNTVSVSIATLCYYMAPTIIILLSPVVLKEKLTIKRIVCALCAIVGMISVSGLLDQSSKVNILGIILGLLAALFYAIVILLNKKAEAEDVYVMTIVELLSASMIVMPYILLSEKIDVSLYTPVCIVMILIVGILHTGISYMMHFSSIQILEAQSVAILSYIDPVFALILSFLILHENFTLLSFTGAVLIIVSALISELK